ncbi:MAG: hypothetical protein ACSLFR_11485 [Solirubrobacteraceae bacterium]
MELTGPADAPLDEPPRLRVRGAGPEARLTWRARVRDDDGRVWRATAETAEGLDAASTPAKTPAAPHAALASLRPVRVEVRAETDDGRSAARTITRHLLADGVKVRRWRGEVTASLFIPAEAAAAPVVINDPDALPAAALLASRGILTLVVKDGDVDAAAARLEAVPGGAGARMLGNVPLPPGVPGAPGPAAWEALLVDLGARPRQAGAGDGSA